MLMSKLFAKKSEEKGFTLIELMIVVAIIGILAAIAVPQISKYRTRAYDVTAKSDLSALALSMEHRYIDTDAYTTVLPTEFNASPNINVTIINTTISGFTATASHINSSNTFTWRSESGGIW